MAFTTREIKVNTLGGLLKRARLDQNWDLKDIEKRIGIEIKYLESLEADDFYKLPSSTYARGFLKRYAEFLKLDSEKIVKQWEQRHNYKEQDSQRRKLKNKKIYQPSKLSFKIILISLVVLLILFYLGFGLKKVLFTPEIEILNPPEDLITKESSLVIKGRVESGTDVFINNQPVEQIKDGLFEQKIELLPGLNMIKISAKRKYSRPYTVYRQVVVED